MHETQGHGDGSDGLEVEKLRRLRLSEFLRDLVRQEGKMEAAEQLGVNHKTLTRAEESGEITGRMGDALELLLRRADDAEVAHLRETVSVLEERVAALEVETETPPATDVEDEHEGNGAVIKDGGEDQVQEEDGEGDGTGGPETGAAPRVVRLRPTNPDTLQPFDPEIVTVQPADDDVEVYGPAWPLVEEWRKLRVGHSTQGKSLS